MNCGAKVRAAAAATPVRMRELSFIGSSERE
jgi:hypothetical protein